MDQSFYIGSVGASQQQRRLNVQGNNIANVNTYGFKAEKARFAALFYQNMMAIEQPEVPYGVGTRLLMTATDHAQGGVATTGRDQDYMIDGDGFFAVLDASTNTVSFTRNGAFSMNDYWRPTNEIDENGNPVREQVWVLTDEAGRFVLGTDGDLIEVTDPTAKQPIGIFDYRNYDGMQHTGSTHFLPVDKNGELMVGTGTLIQRVLESSNVDLAEELTKVIESQRAYGISLKIVQTSDEIENTINNLRS
ncbi:MAG: flagellar hook-basal body complex protein [Dorea sp.]|nr:flagellar hook-basal body complex protein [Dorea sp.]